jgi:hypothetical protein
MCVVNLFEQLSGSSTTGGTWTQDVQPGNSVVTVTGNTIDTTGINIGTYIFTYEVDNGTCSDTEDVTIEVLLNVPNDTFNVCIDNGTFDIYGTLSLDLGEIISNSNYTLTYASGSPTSASINLGTGIINTDTILFGTYLLNISLNDAPEDCDCTGLLTINIRGCTDVDIIVDGCTVTWTPTCSGTTVTSSQLEEFNDPLWEFVTSTQPYTVPDGEVKTLRVQVFQGACTPAISDEVTVSCIPTLCDTCNLYLTLFAQNVVGKLSVGVIASNNCTVGNYVIDWYLDSVSPGNLQFTTGKGPDTDIEVQHPFTGNAAIPVIGGVYIPIIRYVYLNGILYAPDTYLGAIVSPDLEACLPEITVVNPSCDNGGIGQYAHTFSYTANTNFANATRTLHFDYTVDDLYLAYRFTGYTVSDRVKLTHVNALAVETVLEDVVIGNDINTTNYSVTPKLIKDSNVVKGIIEFPPFIIGSYIKIEITPSYLQPLNQNTSWELGLKCLETFTCTCPDMGIVNVGSISCVDSVCSDTIFVNEPLTCNTDLQYITATPTQISTNHAISQVVLCNVSSFPSAVNACVNMNGILNITKIGNIFTMDFDNSVDYLAYKSAYFALPLSGDCNNPTSIAYYRRIIVNIRISATNCGDSVTGFYPTFHECTVPTFNDTNFTIIWTLPTPLTNQYPITTCNSCTSQVDSAVNQINGIINAANGIINITTRVRDSIPFNYVTILPPQAQTNSTTSYRESEFFYRKQLLPASINLCSLLDSCETVSGQLTKIVVGGISTTVTNLSDACNNFEVYNRPPDVNGCVAFANTPVLIYKIVNGVQTVP